MEDQGFINHFIREEIYLVDEADTTRTGNGVLVVADLPLNNDDEVFLNKIFDSVGITPNDLTLLQKDYNLEEYQYASFSDQQLRRRKLNVTK